MSRISPTTERRPLLEARTTVSLEQEAYEVLAKMAFDRRVSIGCVVREAVADYINSHPPSGSKPSKRRS